MKRYRIVYSVRAELQIDRILLYIAEASGPKTATDFIARALDFIDSLEVYPQRGTARSNGIRAIGFERALTVRFRIRGDDVRILGVYYRGQRLPPQEPP